MILLHLLILLSKRSLKSSLESKITPKCFWLAANLAFVNINSKQIFCHACKRGIHLGCLVQLICKTRVIGLFGN